MHFFQHKPHSRVIEREPGKTVIQILEKEMMAQINEQNKESQRTESIAMSASVSTATQNRKSFSPTTTSSSYAGSELTSSSVMPTSNMPSQSSESSIGYITSNEICTETSENSTYGISKRIPLPAYLQRNMSNYDSPESDADELAARADTLRKRYGRSSDEYRQRLCSTSSSPDDDENLFYEALNYRGSPVNERRNERRPRTRFQQCAKAVNIQCDQSERLIEMLVESQFLIIT
ncbi:hypothetical protein AB6A40_006054 [Gnathostoma spinigerum]|uniref:Uncharacterized protein n=1 Tax=Gnathostoma spinigerum TaxID=75299 RepID=A0ABD6EIE6_9BILA